jgi:cytochrome bd-type quinol oxidase subunit 2
MFLVAIVGMAVMLGYTYWVRKVFKGGSVEY